MKFTVEFELHSNFGGSLAEAVERAMSTLGSIEKLKIVPVSTYTLYIQLNPLQVGEDTT
jgi:hypothetical protein